MEFEQFAASTRKVSAGDLFAVRPSDGRGFMFGQVLAVGVTLIAADEARLPGPSLVLVAFFAGRAAEPHIRCEKALQATIADRPFITNKTAWRDGRFQRLQNCATTMPRVGVRRPFHLETFTLDGSPAAEADFDIVVPSRLSTYGAISRRLGQLGL